jgi:D-beta-D-heptose 7-phosphate kinase/D-beta-D-heptose 1-phosphate adenosyltransferase
VNGSFDILHAGHIRLFNYAKSLGNHLLVAIDSDDRISKLKGPKRPINFLADRKLLLENLKAIDAVWSFDSDEELEHIMRTYSPNIMVKGSDYNGGHIIGEQYCGEILFLDRTNDSTTKKIQSIIDR